MWGLKGAPQVKAPLPNPKGRCLRPRTPETRCGRMTWRNRPPPEPRGEGPLHSEPPRRVTEPSRLPPRHARPPSRVPPRDCHQADPRGSRLLPRARRSRRSHGAFARLCPAGNGFPAAPPGVLTQTPPQRSLPPLGRRTHVAHASHTRLRGPRCPLPPTPSPAPAPSAALAPARRHVLLFSSVTVCPTRQRTTGGPQPAARSPGQTQPAPRSRE